MIGIEDIEYQRSSRKDPHAARDGSDFSLEQLDDRVDDKSRSNPDADVKRKDHHGDCNKAGNKLTEIGEIELRCGLKQWPVWKLR